MSDWILNVDYIGIIIDTYNNDLSLINFGYFVAIQKILFIKPKNISLLLKLSFGILNAIFKIFFFQFKLFKEI